MSQLHRVMEIDRLVRAGKKPRPHYLAGLLEVTERQIYLDRKWLIEELGAPLELDRNSGGWVYTDLTWVLPTAIFTEPEFLALFYAVYAASSIGNGGLEGALASAVAKISRSMGERTSLDIDALQKATTPSAPPAAPIQAQIAFELVRAKSVLLKVSMLYNSASSNKRWRKVHPYHLFPSRGEWIMVAYDEDRQQTINFNIARVEELEVLKEYFELDPTFNADEYRNTILWAEAGDQVHDIAIQFDVYQARFIRERTWHPDQKTDDLADGGLILRFPASGLKEVARFVLGYGQHARVLSPPELIEIVRTHIQNLNQMYKEDI